MATLAQVAEYREAIDDLSTLAIADLNEVLKFLDDASPVETRNSLIQLLPELVNPYVAAAGDIAATWYEDLRSTAIGGSYVATSSASVNLSQAESLVRYGVKPLFGQSKSSPLSLLGGGVQKMVAGAGRTTIDFNISRDPVLVGYARIPQAGCCAFCGMLASRGAAYRSRSSAGGVVGRGVDSSIALDENGNRRAGYIGGVGGGVKARGSQSIGKKFHNFCRCVATPVFSSGDNSAYTETRDKFMELYKQTDGLVDKNGYRVADLKATLKSWREEHGSR